MVGIGHSVLGTLVVVLALQIPAAPQPLAPAALECYLRRHLHRFGEIGDYVMHSVKAAQRIDRVRAAVNHLYAVDGADSLEQFEIWVEHHPPVRDVVGVGAQESVDGPFVHGFFCAGGFRVQPLKYAFEFRRSIFSRSSVTRWHWAVNRVKNMFWGWVR
jgi:hypothetical protein